jgi:DNA repair protein RecN (Recombination protein N)
MLLELNIRDFAIIDRLSLQFEPGFNVLTGETGAGKSIIIDALGMLRGDKPDPTLVRASCETARVEGLFSLDDCPDLLPTLTEYGLAESDDDQLILTREISAATGRSVTRVNGRAINSTVLREIGGRLFDIHGQHEGVSLFNVKTHLDLLDRFGNLMPLRQEVAELVDQLRRVRQQLDELRHSEARRQDRIDELRYQIDEIEAANLRIGEEEALLQERTRLQNAAKITELASSAYYLLAESNDASPAAQAVTDQLSAVVSALDELARIDPSVGEILEQATDLLYRLEDLTATVRNYRDSLEFDPGRMEAIEERFLLLRKLQRKYGGSVAELLESVTAAQIELDRLMHATEHLAGLEAEEARLLNQLSAVAGELSRRRRAAGDELSRRVEQSMADLAMPYVQFAVSIEHTPDKRGIPMNNDEAKEQLAFDKTGIDRVEFLISPNPGEPLKPLVRIASGGESARLLLAMKSILSLVDVVPTLVFDEIDVGVGGRAGGVVGEKLWGMTGYHQVLCITHLPQVAAFGDAHYTVRKQVTEGRTRSTVTRLDQTSRIAELAEMLDGTPISEASRRSAEAMLERAAGFKRQDKQALLHPVEVISDS